MEFQIETNFLHPFTALVSGPTGCGKTEFVFKILQNEAKFIYPSPQRIIYCFSIWQKGFDLLKDKNPIIEFKQGLIDVEELDSKLNNLVILDDLMKEASEHDDILHLFTRGSHHKNTSVFLLTQNIFNKGKNSRTISLNCHYIVLFKNPRDMTQISYLARQMQPKHSKYLEDAFKDATKNPHGYLFLDMKQATPDILRVQSNIFSDLEHYVYIQKN